MQVKPSTGIHPTISNKDINIFGPQIQEQVTVGVKTQEKDYISLPQDEETYEIAGQRVKARTVPLDFRHPELDPTQDNLKENFTRPLMGYSPIGSEASAPHRNHYYISKRFAAGENIAGELKALEAHPNIAGERDCTGLNLQNVGSHVNYFRSMEGHALSLHLRKHPEDSKGIIQHFLDEGYVAPVLECVESLKGIKEKVEDSKLPGFDVNVDTTDLEISDKLITDISRTLDKAYSDPTINEETKITLAHLKRYGNPGQSFRDIFLDPKIRETIAKEETAVKLEELGRLEKSLERREKVREKVLKAGAVLSALAVSVDPMAGLAVAILAPGTFSSAINELKNIKLKRDLKEAYDNQQPFSLADNPEVPVLEPTDLQESQPELDYYKSFVPKTLLPIDLERKDVKVKIDTESEMGSGYQVIGNSELGYKGVALAPSRFVEVANEVPEIWQDIALTRDVAAYARKHETFDSKSQQKLVALDPKLLRQLPDDQKIKISDLSQKTQVERRSIPDFVARTFGYANATDEPLVQNLDEPVMLSAVDFKKIAGQDHTLLRNLQILEEAQKPPENTRYMQYVKEKIGKKGMYLSKPELKILEDKYPGAVKALTQPVGTPINVSYET